MVVGDVAWAHISFAEKRQITADTDCLLGGQFSLSDEYDDMVDDVSDNLAFKMYRFNFKRYRVNGKIYSFMEVEAYRTRGSSSSDALAEEGVQEDCLWVVTMAFADIKVPLCFIVFLGTAEAWERLQCTCTVVRTECWQAECYAALRRNDAQLEALD